MKTCPYCAEEIQSAAIKCRFCGEWIEKPEENSNHPTTNVSEELLSCQSDKLLKKNTTITSPQEENNDSKQAAEANLLSIIKKTNWGWGWILLLGMFDDPVLRAYDYSRLPVNFQIMKVCLLLIFYFWYRQKLITKNEHGIKIWQLSLRAGCITIILANLLSILVLVTGISQEKKETQLLHRDFFPSQSKNQ